MVQRPFSADARTSIVGGLTVRLFGAASAILAARLLGTEGRGQLALTILLATVVAALLTTGLDVWVAREVARRSPQRSINGVIARHLGAAAAVAAVAVAGALTTEVGRRHATAVVLVGVLAWVTTASLLARGVLQGQHRMGLFVATNVVSTGGYALALGVLYINGSDSVDAALAGAVAGQSAALLLATLALRRTPRAVIEPARRTHRRALQFGIPSALGALVTLLLYRVDIAIVAVYQSTSDVGIYAVALSIAELLWVLPTSTADVLLPRASDRQNGIDVAVVTRLTVVMLAAAATVVVALGPIAIPLVFGSDFARAFDPLPFLAFAAVAVGIWKLLIADFLAAGESHHRFVSALIALGVMVGADVLLIPHFGITGAGAGSALAYCAAAVYVVAVWRRRKGVRLRSLLVPTTRDVTLLVRVIRERSNRSAAASRSQ